jgi:hypothetical protein
MTTNYTTDLLGEGSEELSGAFTARDYHAGEFTALYAMSSTGSLELYKGEGLERICRELRVAISCAEEQGFYDDAENIARFLQWCENN